MSRHWLRPRMRWEQLFIVEKCTSYDPPPVRDCTRGWQERTRGTRTLPVQRPRRHRHIHTQRLLYRPVHHRTTFVPHASKGRLAELTRAATCAPTGTTTPSGSQHHTLRTASTPPPRTHHRSSALPRSPSPLPNGVHHPPATLTPLSPSHRRVWPSRQRPIHPPAARTSPDRV